MTKRKPRGFSGRTHSVRFKELESRMNFFQVLMKTARRPFLFFLSLLAIFILQLPASLWACPMTGIIGNATEVCHGAMPIEKTPAETPLSNAAPCNHLGGKCCKPLSLPPASQTDDKHSQHSFTAAADSVTPLSVVPVVASWAVIWPQAPQQISVPEQAWLALSFHPPPQFISLHHPAALAGRAPPTL